MKPKNLLIYLLIITAGLMQLSDARAQALAPIQDHPDGPFYMPGEVLIRFKAGAPDPQLLQAIRLAEIFATRHIQTPVMARQGHPGVTLAFTRRPVAQAIQALQNHPAVEYAEPNWVYTHQSIPDDPLFTDGSLWGMYGDVSDPANAYGSQAAEAWSEGNIGALDNVVIGVIDEGIQVNHEDLFDNIWINAGEIPGDGLDNDGNGSIDDIYGWNFLNESGQISADPHGTHVAGTIGAVGNNGEGVVGVNWQVQIISAQFLGPFGGTTEDAIEAVDYLTDLKQSGVPIVAINNSWGGGGYSQSLHDAIIRAAKADILFVASAGNGNFAGRAINIDTQPYYPACYDTSVDTSTEPKATYDAVISVTAIDSRGKMPRWANYGATSVDLGAPGVGIYSTLPPSAYGAFDGTSMAAPHVTGAVALYASTHPGATAAEIKEAILNAAAPTDSLVNKSVTGGRLDLSTVITPAVPPLAPTGLTAVAGDGYVDLSWTGSAGAASYNLYRSTESWGYDLTQPHAYGLSGTSYTDTTVVNGTTYFYVVTAVNSVDESAVSDQISAKPEAAASAPEAPDKLTATVLSKSSIELTWEDKSNNELGFTIQRTTEGSDPVMVFVDRDVTRYPDTGLQPNTLYTYDVRAYNNEGDSGELITSATTFPQPSAVFAGKDTNTKGTWKLVYGSLGYHIYRKKNDPAGPYISGLGDNVSIKDAIPTTWVDPTPDTRALQRPEDPNERFADCYYNHVSFEVIMNLPEKTRVSFYCVDWDRVDRRQDLTIRDASDLNTVLDTRVLEANSDFTEGCYLAWDLEGHVNIRIRNLASMDINAVLSGIFFDAVPVTPPPSGDTMHCADLDGVATSVGANWIASVTVTIHDDTGNPVSGATVSGEWSGGFSGLATSPNDTDQSGQVVFQMGSIRKNRGSVTFTLQTVSHEALTYEAAANHDPDGDSDGTSITVTKP